MSEKHSEKVFCNSCAYHRRPHYSCDTQCRHPANTEMAYNYSQSYKKRIKFPKELNRDNNCKNYKPKWWRKDGSKIGIKYLAIILIGASWIYMLVNWIISSR